jgi:hypothetical protein
MEKTMPDPNQHNQQSSRSRLSHPPLRSDARLPSAAVSTFADRSIRAGLEERPETFIPKKGRVDVIRILTMPVRYFFAWIENPETGKTFGAISCAPFNLIEQARDTGDWDPVRAACPLFARGYIPCDYDEATRSHNRFAMLIYHIESTEPGRSSPKRVGQVLPWCFANKIYTQLRNIQESLGVDKNGRPRDIRSVVLRLTCDDDKFKSVTILPITHSSTWAEAKAAVMEANIFDPPEAASTLDPMACTLILETVRPKPRSVLDRDLEKIEAFRSGASAGSAGIASDGATGAPDGEFYHVPSPGYGRKQPPAVEPRPVKPSSVDPDDLDAILGAGDPVIDVGNDDVGDDGDGDGPGEQGDGAQGLSADSAGQLDHSDNPLPDNIDDLSADNDDDDDGGSGGSDDPFEDFEIGSEEGEDDDRDAGGNEDSNSASPPPPQRMVKSQPRQPHSHSPHSPHSPHPGTSPQNTVPKQSVKSPSKPTPDAVRKYVRRPPAR